MSCPAMTATSSTGESCGIPTLPLPEQRLTIR
jgi:hypothetical protein